jgi:hypothetical protein
MDKEITDIRPTWGPIGDHAPIWKVTYTVNKSGRTYFKHVHAKDEMEAYMFVMGLRKQPQPT